MAQGIDLARQFAPEHAAVIENLKEQLLIVFLKRLGGKVSIPVEEVDDTGGDILAFNLVGRTFNFEIQKKMSIKRTVDDMARAAGMTPPVDRAARTLTDGSPITDDHRDLKPNGQQKGYVVLSEEERARGYVRPVRLTYVHKPCGAVTRMSRPIAETYARDPDFYTGTFCVGCGSHFPLDQFVWEGTDEQVGS